MVCYTTLLSRKTEEKKSGKNRQNAFAQIFLCCRLLAWKHRGAFINYVDIFVHYWPPTYHPVLVWDQNTVSVTVWAESIGISFPETETFFSIFFHVFLLLRGIQVLKNLKLNTDLQKLFKKLENLAANLVFIMEKIPHTIGN